MTTNGTHTNSYTAHISAATKLRKMIEDPHQDIIVGPGVYDGFSARIATSAGFDILYMVSRPHPFWHLEFED
jgi:2-methylisocitrate lyase-like PEP mutase family enzyme